MGKTYNFDPFYNIDTFVKLDYIYEIYTFLQFICKDKYVHILLDIYLEPKSNCITKKLKNTISDKMLVDLALNVRKYKHNPN